MRAWTFNSRGPPSAVLKLQENFPQPRADNLQNDEVIVEVSYVSMLSTIQQLMSVIPHLTSNPWIPEYEFTGKIVAIGSTAASDSSDSGPGLKLGDEVFGMINLKKGNYNGVLAEYIVAPLETVGRKPDNISFLEISGLGGDGCTSIGFAESTGLIDIIGNADNPSIDNKAYGKRILVTGGSTGLGLATLQLMKTLVGSEGKVVTTASPRNESLVRKMGADEVIDYRTHPALHTHLTSKYSTPSTMFDVIIDISGTDPYLYPSSPAYLRPDGYFVFGGNMSSSHSTPGAGPLLTFLWLLQVIGTVLSWFFHSNWPRVLGGTPRKAFFHSGTPSKRYLGLIAQLAEERKLVGVVDSVWKMGDVLKAYEHIAKGGVSGKVVISVQE